VTSTTPSLQGRSDEQRFWELQLVLAPPVPRARGVSTSGAARPPVSRPLIFDTGPDGARLVGGGCARPVSRTCGSQAGARQWGTYDWAMSRALGRDALRKLGHRKRILGSNFGLSFKK